MRITSKGQVTIPQHIRKTLGLLENTEVDFVLDNGSVRLVKREGSSQRGRNVIRALEGQADAKMTTDQIMALTRKS